MKKNIRRNIFHPCSVHIFGKIIIKKIYKQHLYKRSGIKYKRSCGFDKKKKRCQKY